MVRKGGDSRSAMFTRCRWSNLVLSSRRDLMYKMAVLPEWHSLYPNIRKLPCSRPQSSPCRGQRSGLQDLCRPSSSSEYSAASTHTTYCLERARAESRYPPDILCGECRQGPQATFLKVVCTFQVDGQDSNLGTWILSVQWVYYSVNDSCTNLSRPVHQYLRFAEELSRMYQMFPGNLCLSHLDLPLRNLLISWFRDLCLAVFVFLWRVEGLHLDFSSHPLPPAPFLRTLG